MFILRKITTDDIEMNISLGKSYTIVDKERNESEFNRSYFAIYGEQYDKLNNPIGDQKIYAFVGDENGKLTPLYTEHANFIMTSNGQTFSNVSR
jgi:hypothetical protein